MLGDVLSWEVSGEQLEGEGEVTLDAECVQKLQGHHVSSSSPLTSRPIPSHPTSLYRSFCCPSRSSRLLKLGAVSPRLFGRC